MSKSSQVAPPSVAGVAAPILPPPVARALTSTPDHSTDRVTGQVSPGGAVGVSSRIDRAPQPTVARERKDPPANWQGNVTRCGSCGDFIGDALTCPECTGAIATPPKMMA